MGDLRHVDIPNMLNGLDLFSGIGGLTLALSDWVRPIAYCENDRYAQAVLLSRMSDGRLPIAPIWDDVETLRGDMLPECDIIYGGFPCQDISVAGKGKGLEGKRSRLFFEIMRVVDEVRPTFIFLENVPAITTRGLGAVSAEITKRGYDSRWCTLSAAEVGANHIRKRWWLLAYSRSKRRQQGCGVGDVANATSKGLEGQDRAELESRHATECGFENTNNQHGRRNKESKEGLTGHATDASWWQTEPDVGRVVNGLPARVDRIKCLGNAVVPLQAKEAFKELMGLTTEGE